MPHTEPHPSARLNHLSFLLASPSDVLQGRNPNNGPYLPPSNSITIRFGQRLRHLRQRSGMTQIALATHLGLDRSYISDVERGKKCMSLSYLETVAQGFKMSLANC